MKRLFKNDNGQVYYVLFGVIGSPALLCNVGYEQYVFCRVLGHSDWFHGMYFDNFDEAYNFYKKELKV